MSHPMDGREVSCRAVRPLLEQAESDGLDMAALFADLSVTQGAIDAGLGRISWADAASLLRAFQRQLGTAGLVELGRCFPRSADFSAFAGTLGRLGVASRIYTFIAWSTQSRERALFSCVGFKVSRRRGRTLVFDVTIDRGFDVEPAFLTLCEGVFSELPVLVGQPPADVLSEAIDRGVRLHLRIRGARSPLARLRGVLGGTRAILEAGEESRKAYELLSEQHEALEATKNALAEGEARFRQLLDAIPDFVAVLDDTGTVTYIGPGIRDVLGYEPEELSGARNEWVFHPDDQGAVEAVLGQLILGVQKKVTVRVRTKHRDGHWVALEARGRRLDDPALGAFIINYRDVSEQAALQQQLFQSQKMEMVGRLAGGIAHDFNNVLTGIMGYAELIGAELVAPGAGIAPREGLEEVQKLARHAADLTAQLLAFARKQVVQPRWVGVNAVVRDTAPMLRRLLGDRVQLVLELAEELPRVRADPSQLRQVLVNLVINARDAMAAGDILVTTGVGHSDGAHISRWSDAVEGAHVVMSVADQGSGIAAEVLPQIFDPFFTTKEIGRGTGLGLASAHGIAAQNGGHMTVESVVGEGAVFGLWLPVAEAPVGHEPTAESGSDLPDAGVLGPPGGVETLLVVEDDHAVREVLSRRLRGLGYTVLAAADGGSAVAAMGALIKSAAGRLDGMITDVAMPGMSGISLAARLREGTPDLKVLFISGHPIQSAGDGVADGESGRASLLGETFLQKPFTPDQLAWAVRAMLDGQSGG